MGKIVKLIISITVCELVGLMSTPFTISSIQTWYKYLHKPSFSPPNWIFGPVWTVLYLLMGISVYLVWLKQSKSKRVKTALKLFLTQLLFNFLWSIIFFGFHNPLIAFVDIILLWIAIVLTIMTFYRLSKPAAYLLIPYILWVSFAALLNISIVLLN